MYVIRDGGDEVAGGFDRQGSSTSSRIILSLKTVSRSNESKEILQESH